MNLRVSFSLRAFVVYFLALGALTWVLMGKAIERFSIMTEQATELVLIDTVHLAAGALEAELAQQRDFNVSVNQFSRAFKHALSHRFNADVHGVQKQQINAHVYITDAKGVVVYDSRNLEVGKPFGKWRDVRRTLAGKYGARTSVSTFTQNKEMIIAAPIRQAGKLVGVVSVRQDIEGLAETALIEAQTLKRLALIGVLLVTILVFFMSRWLTSMMAKLGRFADAMAAGERAQKPFFLDKRLDKLASSIANMREQIDGKAYVEQYVHSLTHELKTPVTGINAAIEFLRDDGLTDEEQQHFINNIDTSNQRMGQLVERVLNLAKLEHQQGLSDVKPILLASLIDDVLKTFETKLNAKAISLNVDVSESLSLMGDPFLLNQAFNNLLDNAIDFCPDGGDIDILAHQGEESCAVDIFNTCEPIPPYALDRLFDRFYSMPRPHSQKRSTGLGLSFVKEILTLHHGSIDIDNAEQRGKTGVMARLIFNHLLDKH